MSSVYAIIGGRVVSGRITREIAPEESGLHWPVLPGAIQRLVGMANGVALMLGCAFAVQKWVRT